MNKSSVPPMMTAEVMAPMRMDHCCHFGVAPRRKPVLRSCEVVPPLEAAMQTTPPIDSASTACKGSTMPRPRKIKHVIKSVATVMPEIGLLDEPISPVRRDDTVTNRNPKSKTRIAPRTAYVMLRFAPFPYWVRLLAVFGAFLGYEFSVVARNYGIGVLLMLLACTIFPERRERPIRLAVVLALLANTSVHAAIASLVLAFVWLMDFLEPSSRRALLRGRSLAALGMVVAA